MCVGRYTCTGNNRKVTSFIRGLDLCDGRYDTPEHRLFHDLDTVFKVDVHQPTYPVSKLIHLFTHLCTRYPFGYDI